MEEERKWEEMEADCLSVIFQKLAVDDQILSLPFVCKSWSTSAVDPHCWKTLDFRQLDLMPWSSLAVKFSSSYSLSLFSLSSLLKFAVRRSSGNINELRFPSGSPPSTNDLLLVSAMCPKLKILTLPNLLLEDELRIPGLIKNWKDLETLEMESKPCSFTQLAEQIKNTCGNFRELKMSGSIKKEDALAIARCFSKIKRLDLSRSYLPKEELMVILKGCREIEELRVSECVGFEAGDDEINKIVAVRIFEDEGSKLVDDSDYENDDDCDPLYYCFM